MTSFKSDTRWVGHFPLRFLFFKNVPRGNSQINCHLSLSGLVYKPGNRRCHRSLCSCSCLAVWPYHRHHMPPKCRNIRWIYIVIKQKSKNDYGFHPPQVDVLDASDRRALVFFPSNASSGEKFPLIEYAHGAAGGNIDLIGYDRYVRVCINFIWLRCLMFK